MPELVDLENRIPPMVDKSKLHNVDGQWMLLSKQHIQAVKEVFQKEKHLKLLKRTKNRHVKRKLSKIELKLKLPFNVFQDNHKNLYILYQADEPIGKGGYGHVKLGQALETGEWVAIKIEAIPYEKLKRAKDRLLRAIEFEKELGLYFGRIKFPQEKVEKHYVFKKYIFGTILTDLIREDKFKDYDEKLEVAIQVTQLVVDWHNKGYIHGDIKPRNFIVDLENKKMTLIDFGLSHKSESQDKLIKHVRHVAGTKKFMSPEFKTSVYKDGKKYIVSDKTEAYALGETLKRLLLHKTKALPPDSIIEQVINLINTLQNVNPQNRILSSETLNRLKAIKNELQAIHTPSKLNLN